MRLLLVALSCLWLGCSSDTEPTQPTPYEPSPMADGIVHDVTDIGEADAEESGEPDATQPTEPDVTIIADTGSPSDLPTSSETSETLALPEGLAAEAPPANKPLSDFAGVLDTTGTPFSGDQLLGSWTVIWFYPLALTAG